MNVVYKNNKKVCEVYDITYDSTGYPHFLIYDKGQWLRVSAKHFEPYTDKTINISDGHLNMQYKVSSV